MLVKDPKYLSFKAQERNVFINNKDKGAQLKVGIYSKFPSPVSRKLNIWNNEKINSHGARSVSYILYIFTVKSKTQKPCANIEPFSP